MFLLSDYVFALATASKMDFEVRLDLRALRMTTLGIKLGCGQIQHAAKLEFVPSRRRFCLFLSTIVFTLSIG